MKKYLESVVMATSKFAWSVTLAITVCGSVFAQTTTNTSVPFLSSPVVDFLSRSNLIIATYGIYDNTSHKGGGGIGLAYKLSEFVVPTLRFDYINGAIWNPSASLQLQVPVTILGKFQVTPFVFDGIATVFNGKGDHNFEPENIAGIGAAFKIQSSNKWLPAGVIVDYERWTGAGFNDNQVRAGAYWKF